MATAPAAPKTHVIVMQREGIAPAFVRTISHDGSWITTWNVESARRFTRSLAEQKAAEFNRTFHRAVFEPRELMEIPA